MKLIFPTSRGEVIISVNEKRINETGVKKADWLKRLVNTHKGIGIDEAVLEHKLGEAYDIITKKADPDKVKSDKT